MLPRRTYTYESRRYKTTFRHSENTNKKKAIPTSRAYKFDQSPVTLFAITR